MELAVYKTDGTKSSKTVELNQEIFAIEPSDHAIYLDVKQFLANQRQGTHKAKQRNEVKGSTRKLRRQKGTGFARIGDIKSPCLGVVAVHLAPNRGTIPSR
jgi:large subunit ribosomal protein L4